MVFAVRALPLVGRCFDSNSSTVVQASFVVIGPIACPPTAGSAVVTGFQMNSTLLPIFQFVAADAPSRTVWNEVDTEVGWRCAVVSVELIAFSPELPASSAENRFDLALFIFFAHRRFDIALFIFFVFFVFFVVLEEMKCQKFRKMFSYLYLRASLYIRGIN